MQRKVTPTAEAKVQNNEHTPRSLARRLAACGAILLGLLIAATAPLDAAAADRFESGRLWQIVKSGIPDSYVFGTIHIADPRVAAIPGPVERALQRSRVLATEIPLDHALGWLIADAANPATRPWNAMMRTSMADATGGESLDQRLVLRARMLRLPVMPLESVEEQTASFDAIPLVSQVSLLDHVLMHRDALAESRERAIEAWLRGDLAALMRTPENRFPELAPHYRELTRHLIHNRTAVMHYRVFMPLRRGGVFIAVGASHLEGERGLLALLAEDGYRVVRVWR